MTPTALPPTLPSHLPRPVLLLLALLVATAGMLTPATAPTLAATAQNDRLGIDHISYGNGVFSAERYKWAKEAGAGWNRWVLYWNDIEKSTGNFDYSRTDAAVNADVANGFKVLGILMGTPDWATDNSTTQAAAGSEHTTLASLPTPRVGQKAWDQATRLQAERVQNASPATFAPKGLAQPVFADNTDTPGAGKAINDNNAWARYVQRTVDRYKGKVQAWEIWNEPDFKPVESTAYFGFWSGTVAEYARLLKTAYLVIRATDPSATVVIGGMAFWFQQDFFPRLLTSIRQDPQAAANGYYFDATAWHWYSQPDLLYDRTQWVQQTMERAGIRGKRVWVTEADLPVCQDPPMKEKDIGCSQGTHRGTPQQQADFVLQALAYAYAAGVERVFLFQLYDDELGFGEYYGLVRNDGTARPALQAAKLAAGLFQDLTEAYRTTSARGRLDLLTFVTSDNRRIRLLWSRDGVSLPAALPLEGARHTLYDTLGVGRTVTPQVGGAFPLTLGPATLDDATPGTPPEYIVGGPTQVLVEEQAVHQWTVLEGTVTDNSGRPMGGSQVRIGIGTVTADGQGRYRIEIRPGLYDMSLGRAPGQVPGGVVESVPLWSSRNNSQNLMLQPASQRFLPIIRR